MDAPSNEPEETEEEPQVVDPLPVRSPGAHAMRGGESWPIDMVDY